jgi:hypothetical protein
MTPETVAALLPHAGASGAQPMRGGLAGAGFNLSDVARFEAAMSAGAAPGGAAPAASANAIQAAAPAGGAEFLNSEAIRNFFNPLERINGTTEKFMQHSEKLAADPDVQPGDMLMMMVTTQKFMFECQLTSSVANRTSDGIQELFRQQS